MYTTRRELLIAGERLVRLFTTITGLRCYLDQCRSRPIPHAEVSFPAPVALAPTVSLVPTMGALHAGHLSLIDRARQQTDIVVVSIFVNPLQFGPSEDFQKYPRTLEQDQSLCEQAGVDVIFAPTAAELYPSSNSQSLTQVIPPAPLIVGLCGRSRPGHFQGVATVVTKLLAIVQPDRAYFGQKDAQQLAVIRQLVLDLNLPVEIVGCPIVREPDGLAMSSRNRYLSTTERSQATVLYRSLQFAAQRFQDGKLFREDLIGAVNSELAKVPEVKPDYVELVHPDTMTPLDQLEEKGLLAIAAHVGTTRLIDNILLHHRQPILAIDGPAGAGKSTVVRQVAQTLGLLYLDTGAMYRAVTWLALKSGISPDDEPAIAELVSQCDISISGDPTAISVRINGQDVTQPIRSPQVTAHVSAVAAQPAVRQELVKRQQSYGRRGGIVMEGRDIGTYVFPDAELKVFLTASVQERARRRQVDLQNQGVTMSLDELEQTIAERDRKDSHRLIAPLKKAIDAIEIQTDHLTIDQVTAKIVELYREKLTEFQ